VLARGQYTYSPRTPPSSFKARQIVPVDRHETKKGHRRQPPKPVRRMEEHGCGIFDLRTAGLRNSRKSRDPNAAASSGSVLEAVVQSGWSPKPDRKNGIATAANVSALSRSQAENAWPRACDDQGDGR